MHRPVARWLLFNLHSLAKHYAESSPDFFFGGIEDDRYAPGSLAEQQLVVDAIYRCLRSNIIDISPGNWMQLYGLGSFEEFCFELGSVNFFGGPRSGDVGHGRRMDKMVIWLGPQLHCTEIGQALVRRYFPEELDLKDEVRVSAFCGKICELFEADGIRWTSDPAIPLQC